MNLVTDFSDADIEAKPDYATDAKQLLPLPAPNQLKQSLAISPSVEAEVQDFQLQVKRIVAGEDSRLLVIVGPCSLHCNESALEYARRLKALQSTCADSCLLVMRAYLEKPRTTVGWKGMLYDPAMSGASDLRDGLKQSRALLLALAEVGVPLATEALNPLAFRYFDDLISWVAIGARTTESQTHREMASGLACAVGFKNGTDGGLECAVNAISSASQSHDSLGMSDDGCIGLLRSAGNRHCQMVLRGGKGLSNYDPLSVTRATEQLERAGHRPSIVVDCSHENSAKDHRNQHLALKSVKQQRDLGVTAIKGVMLESHLQPGKQSVSDDLSYGVSVTDACIGWEETEALIKRLAE